MEDQTELSIVEENEIIYNIKHRAFYLGRDIVLFIGKQQYDRIYFSFFDQLVRCSTSIGANLVEGVAGSSKKDFINFNTIALKSANETKYWLRLIMETVKIDKEQVERFINEADEVSKIIAKIVINSKQNNL